LKKGICPNACPSLLSIICVLAVKKLPKIIIKNESICCINYTLLLFKEKAINKVKRKNSPENTMINPVENTKSLTSKKSKIESKNSDKPTIRIKKVLRLNSVVIARDSDKQSEKLMKTLIPKMIL
jgi:hypothetical protein